MKPRTGVAAALAFSAIIVALFTRSPAHTDQALPVPQMARPNLSWSQPALQPIGQAELAAEPVAEPAGPSSVRVQRAIPMQDGTVIWAAQRDREGNAPAREH